MKLNLLKYRLKRTFVPEVNGRIPDRLLNHAMAEAEALAYTTPYPLLFLPGLVEEKILEAGDWTTRQQEILEKQRALAADDSLAIAE